MSVNGEIYNHVELRAKLPGQHVWMTHSDCEVLLHAYSEYGPAFLSHIKVPLCPLPYVRRHVPSHVLCGILFPILCRTLGRVLSLHQLPSGHPVRLRRGCGPVASAAFFGAPSQVNGMFAFVLYDAEKDVYTQTFPRPHCARLRGE